MKVRWFVSALLVFVALPLGADERLAIKVSPSVAFAPANLVVRARISSNTDNRAVEVVAESPDFYRSSLVELDGENAARTQEFDFHDLPPGMYEVRATLMTTKGAATEAKAQVNVVAAGADR